MIVLFRNHLSRLLVLLLIWVLRKPIVDLQEERGLLFEIRDENVIGEAIER